MSADLMSFDDVSAEHIVTASCFKGVDQAKSANQAIGGTKPTLTAASSDFS